MRPIWEREERQVCAHRLILEELLWEGIFHLRADKMVLQQALRQNTSPRGTRLSMLTKSTTATPMINFEVSIPTACPELEEPTACSAPSAPALAGAGLGSAGGSVSAMLSTIALPF